MGKVLWSEHTLTYQARRDENFKDEFFEIFILKAISLPAEEYPNSYFFAGAGGSILASNQFTATSALYL